ncbi:hypothetical protein P5673_014015 [Acropora cervicornis]|uniref:Uncharacterized protein n=1 Tax=Acropora cervicornis TaxID=6130 RepID=A0AAD9QKI7_ACRCE|nr:hypothetical protein P5673_014015 [Acropora cervicornis]
MPATYFCLNFMTSYNIAIKAYTKICCKDIICILTNKLINFSIMNLKYQRNFVVITGKRLWQLNDIYSNGRQSSRQAHPHFKNPYYDKLQQHLLRAQILQIQTLDASDLNNPLVSGHL